MSDKKDKRFYRSSHGTIHIGYSPHKMVCGRRLVEPATSMGQTLYALSENNWILENKSGSRSTTWSLRCIRCFNSSADELEPPRRFARYKIS